MASRTWARNSGSLTTDYSYSSTTGELTSVDYSDTTPDISYTYNRLGQQKTVSDVVGTRTFAYNSALQLESEEIAGLYNKTITRDYETTGFVGRYAGFHIGAEMDVDYSYDSYGRFSSVTNGSDTFTYGYLANSNLVSGITYPNNISVTKNYESNRDLITSVSNLCSSVVISQYDYSNDDLGRRTSMAKSGTAFSASDTINYGYNSRSEVTSATAATDTLYQYGYDFDSIGNRLSSTSSESSQSITRNYTTNALNQYTSIQSSINPTIQPQYDDDGNMTSGTAGIPAGIWNFTWNCENRKISAESATQRLEFAYDYMGRRVEKKVYSGSIGNWTLDKHLKFVYDGYEQIEELDGLNSNAVLKKRIWGMDKLIAEIQGASTYYAVSDANKNITEYLTNAGVIACHKEYSPFGKITKETGSMSGQFDYGFSSEYYDSETNTIYYNFRDYDVDLGRWHSRDPIEERGGVNLYLYVFNSPTNLIDKNGNIPAIYEKSTPLAYQYYEEILKLYENWIRVTRECVCISSTGKIQWHTKKLEPYRHLKRKETEYVKYLISRSIVADAMVDAMKAADLKTNIMSDPFQALIKSVLYKYRLEPYKKKKIEEYQDPEEVHYNRFLPCDNAHSQNVDRIQWYYVRAKSKFSEIEQESIKVGEIPLQPLE